MPENWSWKLIQSTHFGECQMFGRESQVVNFEVENQKIELRRDKSVVISDWVNNSSLKFAATIQKAHTVTIKWAIQAGFSVPFEALTASLNLTYEESYTDTLTYTLSIDPQKVARIVYIPNIHRFNGRITTYKSVDRPGVGVSTGAPTFVADTVLDKDHVPCFAEFPVSGGKYELEYMREEAVKEYLKQISDGQPSPSGTSYTIQSGDTLFIIAQKFYGDGEQWERIQQANPGIDPGNLAINQQIVIP